MLTISNHDSIVTPDIVKAFPKDLKDAHDFFTSFHEIYDADADIKETIDLYLKLADKFVGQLEEKKSPGKSQTSTATKKKKAAKPKKQAVTGKKPVAKKKAVAKKKPATRKKTSPKVDHAKKVSQLSPEIKVARRAKNLHGKVVSKSQLATFIKYLQRLILKKEIRKTNPYADTISALQRMAVNFHNGMKGSVETFHLPEALHSKIVEMAGEEKVRDSVRIINRYIGLINTDNMAAMKRLLAAIENALKKKKITGSDPYYKEIKKIVSKVEKVLENNHTLEASETELAGLRDILKRFGTVRRAIKPSSNGKARQKPGKKKSPIARLIR